jgi:hypothetical protein
VTWWHGNIEPPDVDKWFQSYYRFHERYLRIAARAGVEWYSVGAEMHSLTSGRDRRKSGLRYGYPEKWVSMIEKARAILGPGVKITYGVNYTDQAVRDGGVKVLGGELKQWQIFMTQKPRNREEERVRSGLLRLWCALDLIGIDYYRALASGSRFPAGFDALAELLSQRTSSHATELDTILTEISLENGCDRDVYFQEVGYRSVTNGFLSPAAYESRGGEPNALHQAAAWEAVFRGYWEPRWPWMKGVGAWQVLVDRDVDESGRATGFSPFDNRITEKVMKRYLSKPAP